MQKTWAVTVFSIVFMSTTTLAEDCQCGDPVTPYVQFIVSNETEIDEASWRLIGVESETVAGEPERCNVELEMVEHFEEVLYQGPFREVPAGEFEIHFTGSWMLASEVEEILKDTQCLSHM